MPSHPSATLFDTDTARWRAVQQRNAAADGAFVYAVRTTLIYCRPNCKARLARRANVVFFSGPATAEDSGFRACKRCKPRVVGIMPEDRAVVRIREMLQEAATGAADYGTLGRMASQAGVSRWHFHRKFKELTGLTPLAYLRQQRAAQAQNVGNCTEAGAEAFGSERGRQGDWGSAVPDQDAVLGFDRNLSDLLSSWNDTLLPFDSSLDNYFTDIDTNLLDLDASVWDVVTTANGELE
ncbi:DNA repair and transcription factor [Grosmannia clavigera kw1407]|uniref:DNA repair and transcription factor n=1 Tax=Grosmannia clavigera (strain kw1407 / UAMH 11150) TaxID=655863 RepID=F0XL28_GROCL|nr:DNA repair and transcription factor [Grosmannia clavigera kw1407]EFX01742.1 DNA repair and transcription factor [Grosmannia clavigera kw1407]